MKDTKFTFDRQRGVVWVCDIEKSSRFLNDNESVEAIEGYLPRLHWLAKVSANAAGGKFVKWTGDGFLIWFPTDLHREIGPQIAKVLTVIWTLTTINNITCLGIEGGIKVRLRHGLTVEHDALVTNVSDEHGNYSDLIGRAVVLAFRFSGIKVAFPGIVTQGEVIEEIRKENYTKINFKRLVLSSEDRLKYFKGDRRGTTNLFASADRTLRRKAPAALLRTTKKVIAEAEKPATIKDEPDPIIRTFMEDLLSGPEWTQEVLRDYFQFFHQDVLGILKKIVSVLESVPNRSS